MQRMDFDPRIFDTLKMGLGEKEIHLYSQIHGKDSKYSYTRLEVNLINLQVIK